MLYSYVYIHKYAHTGAYGPQADMWSMGCILYEMLIGKAAFPYLRSERELYTRIQKKQYDTSCKEYTALSENAKDLIAKLLAVDPVKRLLLFSKSNLTRLSVFVCSELI